MSSSRRPFDGRPAAGEILLAARWLDPDRRAWLRHCHPVVTASSKRWTIVAPDGPELARLQETLPGAAVVGVRREGLEFPLWRSLRPLVASGRFAAVHALDLSAVGHASLACLGSRLPLLASVPQPPDESRHSGLVGSLERWLLGRALAGAAAVVASGEEVKECLLRVFPNLRVQESKIHTIPYGVDVRPYQQETTCDGVLLRRLLRLDEETMLVGYLGPFTPEAGFPLLLEATARLARFGGVTPFHLVAFGDGPASESTEAVERLGLAAQVTLREGAEDLAAVLEQLDLVVVPAVRAASPRVALEALCAGVPVVGTDCAGLREALAGSPARVVQAGVVAALEAGLRQALFAPRFEAAAAYAPVACARFDHRQEAAGLVRLYDELTGGARAAPQAVLAAGG